MTTKQPRRPTTGFGAAPSALGYINTNATGPSAAFAPSSDNNDDLVQVYRNLHTGTYSMQRYLPNPNPDSKSYGKRSWRVVGHPESLNMRNVSFKVNENRRQGVVQTGTKQVHAFVRGILAEDKDLVETTERVKYNPFKNSTFVDSEDLPVHRADAIRMRPGGDLQMYRSGNHE